MNTRKLTEKVVVGAIAGLVAYDVYVAMNQKTGDTISEVIADAAVKNPIVAVGAGILIGHWFWAIKQATKESQ